MHGSVASRLGDILKNFGSPGGERVVGVVGGGMEVSKVNHDGLVDVSHSKSNVQETDLSGPRHDYEFDSTFAHRST